MPESDLLGPLVKAIETARRRIEEHRSVLINSETRTRLSLIDPVLQALGWDVSNPSQVSAEEPTETGRSDYALSNGPGAYVAVIEAKSLDTPLQPSIEDKVLVYARRLGSPYAGFSDGNQWVLFPVGGSGRLSDSRVLDIRLIDGSIHESALKLLLLWRPNVESGGPVEAAKPIVGVPIDEPETPTNGKPPILPESPPVGGVSLPDYRPDQHGIPRGIRFPDGDIVETPTWRTVFGETLAWLNRKGSLKLPLLNSRGFVLATLGQHRPDNREYTQAIRAGKTDIFFEGHASAKRLCRLAAVAVDRAEENPKEFLMLPQS